MSPEEVVFQSNVLVRRLLDYLVDGETNLLSIALINKKFYDEVCSRLRRIQYLRFETAIQSIAPESPSTSSDGGETKEMQTKATTEKNFGFNGIFAGSLPTFESNVTFATKQSSATSLDVQELWGHDDLKLDPLLRFNGIKTLIFHPSQRHTSNQVYLKLIAKNLSSLRKLVHPPENFLKSLLAEVRLDLDFLEIDLGVFRSMCNGIRDGENLYVFQVQQEFEEILQRKLKIKSLVLHGHNRVRYQSFFQTLLTESNVSCLKMVAEEPLVLNEDLVIFQEWKKRNKRFPMIHELEVIFWNDILRNEYDSAIPLLLEVFPHLSKLMFGTRTAYSSADECMETVDNVHAYWKKNIHQQKLQHCINISAAIPKEQRSTFELRLMNHKSYRSLSKSSDVWTFSMRINYSDEILFTFNLL